MGARFADHRAVVYENDSRDDTVGLLERHATENERFQLISESLGRPAWGATRSPERMAHMAAARNRLLAHVLEHDADRDYVIVLDLDLPRGFSYDGFATCFGYEGWDWMGSNGILGPRYAGDEKGSFFYDAWAFRWPGDSVARPFEEVNALSFHRGAPPVPVDSCFGGMAIYRMEAFRSGARYSGRDCEHVGFHAALRERGFGKGYLNPSLISLYSRTPG